MFINCEVKIMVILSYIKPLFRHGMKSFQLYRHRALQILDLSVLRLNLLRQVGYSISLKSQVYLDNHPYPCRFHQTILIL